MKAARTLTGSVSVLAGTPVGDCTGGWARAPDHSDHFEFCPTPPSFRSEHDHAAAMGSSKQRRESKLGCEQVLLEKADCWWWCWWRPTLDGG